MDVLNLNWIGRPPFPARRYTRVTSTASGSPMAFSLGAASWRRVSVMNQPEFLAQLVAIKLAGLHLVQKVEGGFLGRRSAYLGDVFWPFFLLVFEE